MSYWWGEYNPNGGSPIASDRLLAEAEVWKNQFPKGSVRLVTAETDWDTPFWLKVENIEPAWDNHQFTVTMTIRFADSTSGGQPTWEDATYKIRIVYSSSYPSDGPAAHLLEPYLQRYTPHTISHNRLCLYGPHEGRQHGWDPSENTGATIGLWAVQWLRAYREYQRTRKWPGESGY